MPKIVNLCFLLIILSLNLSQIKGIALTSDDIAGCGTYKGCYFVPPNCEQSRINNNQSTTCTGAFIFAVDNKGITFTLIGTESDLNGAGVSPHFVAVGFSLDDHMGDDLVIACILNGTSGYIFKAWNDKLRGYLDRQTTPMYITTRSTSKIDSDMKCQGSWSFNISTNLSIPNDLKIPSNSFHLLLARGYVDQYSMELKGHPITDGTGFPWVSATTVQFCTAVNSCSINGTSQLRTLNQAQQSAIPRLVKHFVALGHAAFMLVAFWVLVGPAILTARYLKCQKSSFWFIIHGLFMITAFLLVTAGFFGIFYQAQWRIFTCSQVCSYEEYVKFVHVIVGIFAYICMCLQVLAGICRPKQESGARPYFNWFHTGLGFTTFIAGSTCIVLGTHLGKTGISENQGHWAHHIATVILATFIGVAFLSEIFSRRNKYYPDGVSRTESKTGGCNAFSVFLILLYTAVAILGVYLLISFLFWTMVTRGFKW